MPNWAAAPNRGEANEEPAAAGRRARPRVHALSDQHNDKSRQTSGHLMIFFLLRWKRAGRKQREFGPRSGRRCDCAFQWEPHMRAYTQQSFPAASPWPGSPGLRTQEQMCFAVMSAVFVQPGFVNRSSIAAAVCLRVDREPRRTPGERHVRTALWTHTISNPLFSPHYICHLYFLFSPGWKKEQL